MYHPLVRDFQKVLNEEQILLTPNEERKTVFVEKSPMIGWRKARNLKAYLVRAKITNKDTKNSASAQYNGKRCQGCHHIEETCEFEDSDRNKYDIGKGVINCNTNFTVYKFHCSSCSKQYLGSNIIDFRYQFNNYKSAFRKVSKSVKPPKVNREHFISTKLLEHNSVDDCRVTLIDKVDNRKELRRRESFRQYKLNIFFPPWLNVRNAPAEYE